MAQKELPSLTTDARLNVYNTLTSACTHLWSKGKMQQDNVIPVLQQFTLLANQDPLFMAHFTAWAMKQPSKDMKVVAIYANALNAGDGTLFTETSDIRKPNLRMTSHILLQELGPKLVYRVKELGMQKYEVPEVLREGRHFPSSLRTAITKYIRYREKNEAMMKGIRKSGLRKTMINLYRKMRIRPSDEACAILRWQQRDREIEVAEALSFEGMKPLQIAKYIRENKIPVLTALGALPKITPSIAVALLEQSKGDEPVILRGLFEDAGVLKDAEVRALYEEKAKNAPSFERTERAAEAASDELKKSLLTIKTDKKKEQFEAFKVGKIFMHVDTSPSMGHCLEVAKEASAFVAEMINEPEKNFAWGSFDERFHPLRLPKEFSDAGFAQVLFGMGVTGYGTNMVSGYNKSRAFGADVEIFVSDAGHNTGSIINKIHTAHEKYSKPSAVVLVKVGAHEHDVRAFVEAFEHGEGIPVAVIDEKTLKSSALVMQAIKVAMKGKIVIVDEIMETPLPVKYPDWWYAV